MCASKFVNTRRRYTENDDGSRNPKYPGGVALQTRYLRAEGFALVGRGRNLRWGDLNEGYTLSGDL